MKRQVLNGAFNNVVDLKHYIDHRTDLSSEEELEELPVGTVIEPKTHAKDGCKRLNPQLPK